MEGRETPDPHATAAGSATDRRAGGVVWPPSQRLLQPPHEGEHDVFAPRACHHLYADGEAGASRVSFGRRPLDSIAATRIAARLLILPDTCHRSRAGWNAH